MTWWHDDIRHVVKFAMCGHLEDRVLTSAGQCLGETSGGDRAAVLGLHRASPRGFYDDCLPSMRTWPWLTPMRSPGNPMTRLTQICERSPGQRKTTTSPRLGRAANTRCVFGKTKKAGSDALLYPYGYFIASNSSPISNVGSIEPEGT